VRAVLALMLLTLCPSLAAGTPALREGTPVRVFAPSLLSRSITGTLVADPTDVLEIRDQFGKAQSIPIDSVDSLYAGRSGNRAGRGLLIGSAAGLTVGAVLGFLFEAGFKNYSGEMSGKPAATFGVAGLVLGGITGAAVGSRVDTGISWHMVVIPLD